jgi:hypothetical protein
MTAIHIRPLKRVKDHDLEGMQKKNDVSEKKIDDLLFYHPGRCQ